MISFFKILASGPSWCEKRTAPDYKIMPWPNGRGTTTELFVFPEGTSVPAGTALWRISSADLTEDGPFSICDGYERLIALAEGDGFRLQGNIDTDMRIERGDVYEFSGAEAIECELLRGPCKDLNVFSLSGRVGADLDLLFFSRADETDRILLPHGNGQLIIVCLEGRVSLTDPEGRRVSLRKWESARIRGQNDTYLMADPLQSGTRLALIRIWVIY